MSFRLSVATFLCLLAAPGRALAAHGLEVDGEHLTVRHIVDERQRGLTAYSYLAPARWHDQSQVVWDFSNSNLPASVRASVENPSDAEAFFLYQPMQAFDLRPDHGRMRQGTLSGGMYRLHPRPPAETLLGFVQQARQQYPNFQVVGTKDVPDLPATLKVNFATHQSGIAVKVTYQLNGRPIEEEFYAVYYSQDIPYDGPRGRTWQTNWGLIAVHSFRSPLGTLDRRRRVFSAIVKSIRPNPAWLASVGGVQKYIAQQISAQLKAGYDQIAAAGRLSRQLTANSDAMMRSVDRQLQASRTAASAPRQEAGRSSTDGFDDYVRGVDTVEDPVTGTSQHDSAQQYHWTDGNGSYRNSNDQSYDPNKGENGNWQLMQQAH